MQLQPGTIELPPVHWQHELGLRQGLTTTVLSNHAALELEEPTNAMLVIAGYGERRYTLEKALEHLKNLGVCAIGLTFDIEQVDSDPTNLESYIRRFAVANTKELQERGDLPLQSKSVTHSMAGCLIAYAFEEAPELFGDAALLEPITIGNPLPSRYETPAECLHAFNKRFGRVMTGVYRHVPFGERVHGGLDIAGQLYTDLRHPKERRFPNKFQLAAAGDKTLSVIEHANRGNRVVIVLGSRDPLIIPAEVIPNIEHVIETHFSQEEQAVIKQNLTVKISRGSQHAHMAWPMGRTNMSLAIKHLQQPPQPGVQYNPAEKVAS